MDLGVCLLTVSDVKESVFTGGENQFSHIGRRVLCLMHACPYVCVCVGDVSVSLRSGSDVAPSSRGCQSTISSLPFIAQRACSDFHVWSLPLLCSAPQPRPPLGPSALPFSLSPRSLPCVLETCCKTTDKAGADRQTHTHRHFQPTWARYWAGSEAHGTPRPCTMWLWRSRCVQTCLCLCVCECLCHGMCWATNLMGFHVCFVLFM